MHGNACAFIHENDTKERMVANTLLKRSKEAAEEINCWKKQFNNMKHPF